MEVFTLPIYGWTDAKRVPRLGTIALGIKGKDGIPVAVDYFVAPPEVLSAYPDTNPTELRELDVMFPSEDEEVYMPAYYKRYGKTAGLICRGDNRTANLKLSYAKSFGAKEYGIAVANGTFIHQATGETLQPSIQRGKSWLQIPCEPSCPLRVRGACRPVVQVNVLLPRVPGVLGVYTITTSSWNSYTNIKESLNILQGIAGRVSFIACKLKVAMETVNPELKDGKSVQKKVPILKLDLGDLSLQNIIDYKQQHKQPLVAAGLYLPPAAPPPTPEEQIQVEQADEEQCPELLYEPDQLTEQKPTNMNRDTIDNTDTTETNTVPQEPASTNNDYAYSEDVPPPEPDLETSTNALEFKAISQGKVLKTKDGQYTAWVKGLCTYGSLEGQSCELFVSPQAQESVQLVGRFAPGDIFAAVPERIIDNNRIITSIVSFLAAGQATA